MAFWGSIWILCFNISELLKIFFRITHILKQLALFLIKNQKLLKLAVLFSNLLAEIFNIQ